MQWVPSHFNVPAVARLYDHLFMMEDPPDAEWEKALNPNSLIVKSNALVDPSIFKWGTNPETHFQFERLGFFVVDRQSPVVTAAVSVSTTENPRVVFNLTVLLKVNLFYMIFNYIIRIPNQKPKVHHPNLEKRNKPNS